MGVFQAHRGRPRGPGHGTDGMASMADSRTGFNDQSHFPPPIIQSVAPTTLTSLVSMTTDWLLRAVAHLCLWDLQLSKWILLSLQNLHASLLLACFVPVTKVKVPVYIFTSSIKVAIFHILTNTLSDYNHPSAYWPLLIFFREMSILILHLFLIEFFKSFYCWTFSVLVYSTYKL